MAIEFTDSQLKQMTLDTLTLPKIIDNPEEGTGLIQQKENVYVTKDLLDVTDKQHKIFTDHWTGVASKYHFELSLLNKDKKTDYLEANLVLGGQSLEPHYTQTWPNLVPIVIPSNNGLPVGVANLESETELIVKIDDALNKLINGFGDGTFNDTLEDPYVVGSNSMSFTNGSPTSGDNLITISGADSMLSEVGSGSGVCTGAIGSTELECTTNGGTWTQITSITPLSTDKPFPMGASASNTHGGFSNAERGHQTTSSALDVQLYLENELETKVTAWRDSLISQLDALNTNDETNMTRKNINQLALTSLDMIIEDIDNWLALPVSSVTGRFTDSGLTNIISDKDSRMNTEIPQRVLNIASNLGSVTQAGDGNITGDGVYFDLFEFIKLRIAKSGGTLYSWYGMDLAVKHFDTKISGANKQLSEYENLFTISVLTENAEVGDNILVVDDTSNYSIGDNVKIFDEDTIIIDEEIFDISGNDITLNNGIAIDLSVDKIARVVRVNT